MSLKLNKYTPFLYRSVLCATSLVLALYAEVGYSQPEQVAPEAQGAAKVAPKAVGFDLLELRVKGNTKLATKEMERTLYPFLGLKKSLDTVDLARTALEELYRTNGYQTISVDIPEQDVNNGIVYLQVVEGVVSRLRVKDSHYFSMGKIKEGVPELAEGNVPHFPTMQKQLAELAGESPDRKIQPVLRAGDTPGTLEVDLKVKDELPFHGRVEFNGRNAQTTERLRLVTTMHYDNLWQAMHSASLMYMVSPEDATQVQIWSGTYVMPLFSSDMRLALYGVDSSSNIAYAGTQTSIGAGSIFGARLIKPFAPLDNYSHSATFGVDYKNFKESIGLNASAGSSINTPITYLPFLTQYSGSVRREDSWSSFELGLHFSVRDLGNSQEDFDRKRYKSNANYFYLAGDLKDQHDLPLGMELRSHFSGQVADSPLISNEQFSMGGALNVRGYFETQALADSGAFGSFELYSPNLNHLDNAYFNNFKLFTFIDGTTGWVQSPLPGQKNQYQLAASGAGFNFHIKKYLLATFDVGIPLINLGDVKTGDPRFNFNIATEF